MLCIGSLYVLAPVSSMYSLIRLWNLLLLLIVEMLGCSMYAKLPSDLSDVVESINLADFKSRSNA